MDDCKTCGNRVFISNVSSGLNIHPKRTERLIHALLRRLNIRDTLVSFVFVSDAAMKRLNQRYLNHPWATDVLAFPFASNFRTRKSPTFLGEIIISPKRARVYSKEFGVPFSEELVRYICHGILHLLGYSDKSSKAKKKMRRVEDRLIKSLASQIKGII